MSKPPEYNKVNLKVLCSTIRYHFVFLSPLLHQLACLFASTPFCLLLPFSLSSLLEVGLLVNHEISTSAQFTDGKGQTVS